MIKILPTYKNLLCLVKYYTMPAKPKQKNKKYKLKDESSSTVAEAATAYENKSTAHKANLVAHRGGISSKKTSILSNIADKQESQMSALEKMDAARVGVTKKDLENLKQKTMLDYNKLAKALSVTRATLINKKKQEKFNAALSERIIGLADIYSYGYEVFEDEERFNRWVLEPNQALNGKAPFELIDNQFGREEVRNIIGRIAYGVYS
jgi:putative toxin-antitoxin system antitoxin component (TIGR02293 family)